MSADASTCRYTVLHYKPNLAANIVVGAIYILWALLFCARQLQWRKRNISGWNWAWVLCFGCFFSGAGYFIRLQLDPCQFKMGTFIAQQLFIILSPCFFIAFNYAIFGRLIVVLELPQLSYIKPNKISKLFIWSDCITFFIQGSAGGLQTIHGTMQVWGSRIFLIGVGLQSLSFALFSLLVVVAHFRSTAQYSKDLSDLSFKAIRSTKRLFWAFHATNVFYFIRCIYRVLEYAFGNNGFLMKSEGWLIGLDAAPILLALAIWLTRYPLQILHELKSEKGTASLSGVILVSSDGLSIEKEDNSPGQYH